MEGVGGHQQVERFKHVLIFKKERNPNLMSRDARFDRRRRAPGSARATVTPGGRDGGRGCDFDGGHGGAAGETAKFLAWVVGAQVGLPTVVH